MRRLITRTKDSKTTFYLQKTNALVGSMRQYKILRPIEHDIETELKQVGIAMIDEKIPWCINDKGTSDPIGFDVAHTWVLQP